MAELRAKTYKYTTICVVFFLVVALGLGVTSMFYVGWIKYQVNVPASPSAQFRRGQATEYIYNNRHRGLFYYTVDDADAPIVKANDDNRYFPVHYNFNGTMQGEATIGFWSLTNIMKASVGLHVGYLATVGLVSWMVAFGYCLGRRLIQLAAATLVLGIIAGGIGVVLFHIYIDMEKSSDIPSLPELWKHWPEELKNSTTQTLYLSYGIHIGSLGVSVLALLLVLVLATSSIEQTEEAAASDMMNIYTRDNLAYEESMMDKPARAELWNGFDRLSEKRSYNDRKLRANYPDMSNSRQPHHHHHHHHQSLDRRDDDRDNRTSTPIRQHYHNDPDNYPIRY